MPNKSRFNQGQVVINGQRKNGVVLSSNADLPDHDVGKTNRAVFIRDAVETLKSIPDNQVQPVLIDPPYNLDLDDWDHLENYVGVGETLAGGNIRNFNAFR